MTPTKEQIKRILDIVPVEDGEYVLPQVIKEWEKMRNEKSTEQTEYYSKLAEELCKRNPGIKDFEDFVIKVDPKKNGINMLQNDLWVQFKTISVGTAEDKQTFELSKIFKGLEKLGKE